MNRSWRRIPLAVLLVAGCWKSPEDGRERAGGPGGDQRNVPATGVMPPSKVDGTKDLDRFRPATELNKPKSAIAPPAEGSSP